MELRCKRRFEYVQVVHLSRYSTELRALFRDDQVVIQPTIITIPSLPFSFLSYSSLFSLKRPFQTIPFLSHHELSQQTLRCHLCIFSDRRQSPHNHCVHRLWAFDVRFKHRSAISDISVQFVVSYRGVWQETFSKPTTALASASTSPWESPRKQLIR